MTDVELLRLQVAALFAHDAAGRIVSKNKPIYAPAPRVFLGRSTGGNLWRFRDDLPDDVVARLEPLLAREPVAADLTAPPLVLDPLRAELSVHAPIAEVYTGPAWTVPEDLPPPRRARILTATEAPVLQRHYPYSSANVAAYSPLAAVIEEGVAVAVCFSARVSPHVCEAGLDTVLAARGRGYGADAVAAWAPAVRATGRRPLYSTSWDNAASRRVAEKLGMTMYAVDLSIY